MISRRKGSTLPRSEKILVKLRKHGPPFISDKAGTGDIDKSSFSEFILEGGFILEKLYYRDVAGRWKERK